MGLAGEQNRARRTKPVDGTRTGRSGVGFATGHPASSRGWSSQYTSTGSSGWEGGGKLYWEKCRGGEMHSGWVFKYIPRRPHLEAVVGSLLLWWQPSFCGGFASL